MVKRYSVDSIPKVGPYTHVNDSGTFVHFSGQTGTEQGNKDRKPSITVQTHNTIDNIFKLLEAANITEKEVIKVNVYLTSMDDFEAFNSAYQERFSSPYPARTCVAVMELPLEANVEIEVIAKRA